MKAKDISKLLNKNGWEWFLISTLTPGVVRIQLGSAGPTETCWRKCIEASTLEEAVDKAEKLVNSFTASEYYYNEYECITPLI